MTQALFFKPSYERLKAKIEAVAPALEIVIFDEEGKFFLGEKEVTQAEINPEYFWIHGELLGSSQLKNYFQIMQESSSASWLHTMNTGLDGLPYLALVQKGMRLSNNHSQAIAIAEYVMGQVLAYFQNIAGLKKAQAEKHWKYRAFNEISGTRWLIVGFGHIGQEIAQRAKAFGVEIMAIRRSTDGAGLADSVLPLEKIDQALPLADVVVLACASNDKTRGLINKNTLGKMKKNAVLVNIARGDLLVEEDLQKSLAEENELGPAYAVLDVFEHEPLAEESWMWHHPKVAISPHCSNAGSGMRARSAELFIENLQKMVKGEPLTNEVSERDIV